MVAWGHLARVYRTNVLKSSIKESIASTISIEYKVDGFGIQVFVTSQTWFISSGLATMVKNFSQAIIKTPVSTDTWHKPLTS
jgi:hypothetical protein